MISRSAFKRRGGRWGTFTVQCFSYAALAGIWVYRSILSPIVLSIAGPACRFEPTCSAYAHEAISRHGIVFGSWIALKRLSKCRPFGGLGFDPVPTIDYLNDVTQAGALARRDTRNCVGQ